LDNFGIFLLFGLSSLLVLRRLVWPPTVIREARAVVDEVSSTTNHLEPFEALKSESRVRGAEPLEPG
jgi:hypothetical protein